MLKKPAFLNFLKSSHHFMLASFTHLIEHATRDSTMFVSDILGTIATLE